MFYVTIIWQTTTRHESNVYKNRNIPRDKVHLPSWVGVLFTACIYAHNVVNRAVTHQC